jgi:hypothetical protein
MADHLPLFKNVTRAVAKENEIEVTFYPNHSRTPRAASRPHPTVGGDQETSAPRAEPPVRYRAVIHRRPARACRPSPHQQPDRELLASGSSRGLSHRRAPRAARCWCGFPVLQPQRRR